MELQTDAKNLLEDPLREKWVEPFWTCASVADYSIIDRKRISFGEHCKYILKKDVLQWRSVDLKSFIHQSHAKRPYSPRLQDLRFCLEAIDSKLEEFKVEQEDAPIAFVIQRFTSLGLCYDAANFEHKDDFKELFVAREGNVMFLWKEQKRTWGDGVGNAFERQLVSGGKGENFRAVKGEIGKHTLFCAGEIDAWEENAPVEIKLNLKNKSTVHDYFQCINVGIKKIWSQEQGRTKCTSVDTMQVEESVKNKFHLNLSRLLDQLVEHVQVGSEYRLEVGPGRALLKQVGQLTVGNLMK